MPDHTHLWAAAFICAPPCLILEAAQGSAARLLKPKGIGEIVCIIYWKALKRFGADKWARPNSILIWEASLYLLTFVRLLLCWANKSHFSDHILHCVVAELKGISEILHNVICNLFIMLVMVLWSKYSHVAFLWYTLYKLFMIWHVKPVMNWKIMNVWIIYIDLMRRLVGHRPQYITYYGSFLNFMFYNRPSASPGQ